MLESAHQPFTTGDDRRALATPGPSFAKIHGAWARAWHRKACLHSHSKWAVFPGNRRPGERGPL